MNTNSNFLFQSSPTKNSPQHFISATSNTEYSNSNSIPKPDFSPIAENNMTFPLKIQGSYKKPKAKIPESPMKSPIQKFYTPNKIQGKNLFGSESKINFDGIKPRRLSFNNDSSDWGQSQIKPKKKFMDLLAGVEEKAEEEISSPGQKFLGAKKKGDSLFGNNFNSFKLSDNPMFNIQNDSKQPEGNTFLNFRNNPNLNQKFQFSYQRMDKEFTILKTLSSSKFEEVYKCINNSTKETQVVKKSNKNSLKNDLKTLQFLFNDLNYSSKFNINSRFCSLIKDYWIEEDISDIAESPCNYRYKDKYIYMLFDYYSNGDILDYLSKLEQQKFKFNEDFYWDLIFEMLIGVLFLHQNGFLHLDIKPENFLVDSEGYVVLSDFGLSRKLSALTNIEDVFDGDATYISQEFFKRKSISDLNPLCDVYSLGLSFLEILAKVELPKNGPLWLEMREYKMKTLPNEFLINWNINNILPFLSLIEKMISPPNQRMNIINILEDEELFPEINMRYKAHLEGKYKKSCTGITINIIEDDSSPMLIESPTMNIKNFNLGY